MTSRKRNKAKERKAKKAEKEVESHTRAARKHWICWAFGVNDDGMAGPGGTSIHAEGCNHGIVMPDMDHPVCAFMDSFHVNAIVKNTEMAPNFEDTYQNHPQVWNNDNNRKIATDIFVRIGTNMLLNKCTAKELMSIEFTILMLENYDCRGEISSIIGTRVMTSKLRDLYGGGGDSDEREALKFFRKRTNCKCLKAIHLEARKTLPKLGACMGCEVAKERSLLMVCSRCRVAQYCSRKCQVAAWDEHKCECDRYVKAQQRYAMNNSACDEDIET